MSAEPCGIGLRAPHYAELLERRPALGFVEVHSENFFGEGGPALATLERFRSRYPVSLHGVGLSLGSADPLDAPHLERLAALAQRVDPFVVSEHLCWSSIDGRHANDLLPLPYTSEALEHVATRVQLVQERLGRRILVENVSSYLEFEASTIPEWEFIAEVARRTGCGILLDVNNIWVNAVNHGFDAATYLAAIPAAAIGEIHLAGHEASGDLLIDTHGERVCEQVWELYGQLIARVGARPTLVEWDTNIPALDVLLEEASHADAIARDAR
ncbi:DUF692 domain-containing protein [Usitatibacter palustris]|uniref:UPF0276 protein DSM104440_03130 n=1 Tax=Usitatibacter palustris TaxID=2732487 RepID=A0A6M4H9T0_9PROT|nr:DUF692 domain-containing protein [Usitatibacter palustris]QJR16301.1 hypothetical protein DSM104440_03130 [Usitatibacter palustris]